MTRLLGVLAVGLLAVGAACADVETPPAIATARPAMTVDAAALINNARRFDTISEFT